MGEFYLDYAAATPLDKRVFAAMEPYFSDSFYNPSAVYSKARAVRADIDSARHRIAMVLGAKTNDIVITAGATESVNLAIHGVMKTYGGHVVVSAIEHPAVLSAAAHYSHTRVDADKNGLVSVGSIRESIIDTTTLVSVCYANNELGTVQSLKDIADVIDTIREQRLSGGNDHPLYLHTDASQAAGHLDISVSRLGVDLLTLNAGKCYGPKQVGLLWSRPEVRLYPLIDGGGQEKGLRSGTENVAGIIGFAAALELANAARKDETYSLAKLRDSLQSRLQAEFPDLIVNGHHKRRLANHLHVSLPGLDGERAVFALDQEGVMVATGSACAANKGTRSHVLDAVGMDPKLADASLRLTLGRGWNDAKVTQAADIIVAVLKRERYR